VALQIPDGRYCKGRDSLCPELSVRLVQQSGLAHSRFPHNPHHVPVSLCSLPQEIFEEG
jgi:hypothetical protein